MPRRCAQNRGHGLGAAYDTNLDGYYGSNTLYRLLRPLAIAELIERQVAYADFSVDQSAVELLCFKKSAYAAFTGGSLVHGHPDVDWNSQTQHVFYGTLSQAASSMIASDANGKPRILQYDEFRALLAADSVNEGLHALGAILHDFTMESKPLFWLRLIAFGHICREHVGSAGTQLGFEHIHFNLGRLIQRFEG